MFNSIEKDDIMVKLDFRVVNDSSKNIKYKVSYNKIENSATIKNMLDDLNIDIMTMCEIPVIVDYPYTIEELDIYFICANINLNLNNSIGYVEICEYLNSKKIDSNCLKKFILLADYCDDEKLLNQLCKYFAEYRIKDL